MATVQITAPMPIMMPSMVSIVRILLRASARSAMRNVEANLIQIKSLPKRGPGRGTLCRSAKIIFVRAASRRRYSESRFSHSRGHNLAAAALQSNAGKRATRRAGEHGAIGCGKNAAVARAIEFAADAVIGDRAGIVGADAAEGEIGLLGGANQDARGIVARIGKNLEAADGNFAFGGNHALGRLPRAEPFAQAPKRRDQGDDCADDEFSGEAASGNGGLVWREGECSFVRDLFSGAGADSGRARPRVTPDGASSRRHSVR